MENFQNSHGPCTDKNCGWCCDPVKLDSKKVISGQIKLPQDEDGNNLFIKRDELLIPENDTNARIQIYDCRNYDPKNKKCLDYENRPLICRNTSCLNVQGVNDDEKFFKVVNQKFINIKKI